MRKNYEVGTVVTVAALFASFLIAPGVVNAAPVPSEAVSRAQVAGMTEQISDALSDQSDDYWHQGDYPRIIALDRIVGQADPQDVQAFSNGGWLMESNGDNTSAEAFYQMGCRANPTSSFMSFQLAFFYFNTEHRYDKAVVVLKKSVHDADASDNDWKLLAHSYTKAGELPQALATWKAIKQRFPKAPMVDQNMHEVVLMIQQKQAHAKPQ